MKKSFSERVYQVVRAVPRGRIVSYGGVAALLGQPRAARAVGHALNSLPDESDVPWWRVVNRNGEISRRATANGHIVQKKLLQKEGVKFDRKGRASWEKHAWNASETSS